jgi:hypothetical protein
MLKKSANRFAENRALLPSGVEVSTRVSRRQAWAPAPPKGHPGLLTRTAQKCAYVFVATYRAATVKEQSRQTLFQHRASLTYRLIIQLREKQ